MWARRPGLERVSLKLAKPITRAKPGTPEAHMELKRHVAKVYAEFSPAVVKSKADERTALLGIWTWLLADTADTLRRGSVAEGDAKLKPQARRELAWVMGVATDKLQLLSGQPTAIVGALHEHRHLLPDVLAKMAQVALHARRLPDPKAVPASLTSHAVHSPVD